MRHLLTLKELSPKEIFLIIDSAFKIKKFPELYGAKMKNKILAMIFQKTSTRTRCSFEAGTAQMGGHAIFLDWKNTQFVLADIEDETKTISRYADLIMARMLKHSDIEKMAKASEVPVINGLTEKYHPCQSLGDVMTIIECLGKTEKKGKKSRNNGRKRIKVVYVGIGNNVSSTLSLACVKSGMEFVLCAPEKDRESIDIEIPKILNSTGLYKEEPDPKKALKDADVVYTDSWVNMEYFLEPKFAEEKERRTKKFLPYQVNKRLLGYAKPSAIIMHDMPMHHGYEITKDAAYSKNSVIFQQAENRLHVQKAIMLFLLNRLRPQ